MDASDKCNLYVVAASCFRERCALAGAAVYVFMRYVQSVKWLLTLLPVTDGNDCKFGGVCPSRVFFCSNVVMDVIVGVFTVMAVAALRVVLFNGRRNHANLASSHRLRKGDVIQ